MAGSFPALPAKRWDRLDLLAILGLAALAYWMIFYGLGARTLVPWDEATYAVVVRDIVNNDHWFTPHRASAIYLDKPPLWFWLTAVTAKVFGMNEVIISLWSALFGGFTAVVLFLMGRAMFHKHVGILAAFLLLLTPPWIFQSRIGTLDAGLVLFMVVSLFAFWMGVTRSHRYFLLYGVALALGVYIKGPGMFLAVLIPVVWLMLPMNWPALRSQVRAPQVYWGALLSLAIVLPWHVAKLTTDGERFLDRYIYMNTIYRTSGGEFEQPATYYLHYFADYGEYLFPLGIVAFVWLAREVIRRRDRAAALVLVWVATTFLFFTWADFKAHQYIAPIFPGAALMMAYFFYQAVRDRAQMPFLALALALSVANAIAHLPLRLLLPASLLSFLLVWGAARWWPDNRPATALIRLSLLVYLLFAVAGTVRLVPEETPPQGVFGYGASAIAQANLARSAQANMAVPFYVDASLQIGAIIHYYSGRDVMGYVDADKDLDEQLPDGQFYLFIDRDDVQAVQARYKATVVDQQGAWRLLFVSGRASVGRR